MKTHRDCFREARSTKRRWIGLVLALVGAGAWAIQTGQVELGEGGSYDSTVIITRDGSGRMTFKDNENPTPLTLNEIRLRGVDHGQLVGLSDDDHPQYLNSTRHSSSHDSTFNGALPIAADANGNTTLGAHTQDTAIHIKRNAAETITGAWTFQGTPELRANLHLSAAGGEGTQKISFEDGTTDAEWTWDDSANQFTLNRNIAITGNLSCTAVTGGTWSATAIGATKGGTGLTAYAQGDILYASAANTLAKLTKDTNTTRYLSNTGASNGPAWAQVSLTNGVTGTLPVGSGGTGTATAFTGGSIVYASSDGTYTQNNAKLAWDSTNSRLGVGTNAPAGMIHVLNSGTTVTAPTSYLHTGIQPTGIFQATGDGASASIYVLGNYYPAVHLGSASDPDRMAIWTYMNGGTSVNAGIDLDQDQVIRLTNSSYGKVAIGSNGTDPSATLAVGYGGSLGPNETATIFCADGSQSSTKVFYAYAGGSGSTGVYSYSASSSSCLFKGYNNGGSASTSHLLYLEGSQYAQANPAYIQGWLAIGDDSTPNARLHVDTISTEGQEAVYLKQDDSDQAFIDYEGTTGSGDTYNLNTNTASRTLGGWIMIEINGTKKWIPYYS